MPGPVLESPRLSEGGGRRVHGPPCGASESPGLERGRVTGKAGAEDAQKALPALLVQEGSARVKEKPGRRSVPQQARPMHGAAEATEGIGWGQRPVLWLERLGGTLGIQSALPEDAKAVASWSGAFRLH